MYKMLKRQPNADKMQVPASLQTEHLPSQPVPIFRDNSIEDTGCNLTEQLASTVAANPMNENQLHKHPLLCQEPPPSYSSHVPQLQRRSFHQLTPHECLIFRDFDIQLAKLRTELEQAKNDSQKSLHKLHKLREENRELEKGLVEYREENDAYDARCDELEQEKNDLEDDRDALKDERDDLQEQVNRYEEELNLDRPFKEAYNELKSRYDSQVTGLKNAMDRICRLETQAQQSPSTTLVDQLRREICELKSLLEGKSATIDQLKEQNCEQLVTATANRNTISQLKSQISQLLLSQTKDRDSINQLNLQISQLLLSQTKDRDSISQLNLQVSQLTLTQTTDKSTINQLNSQITQYNQDTAANAHSITQLNGQIAQHLNTIVSRDSTILRIQNQHNAEFITKDNKVAELLADVASYEYNAKNGNEALARQITELKQRDRTIADLRRSLQEIPKMDNEDTNKLEKEIARQQSEISELHLRLSELKSTQPPSRGNDPSYISQETQVDQNDIFVNVSQQIELEMDLKSDEKNAEINILSAQFSILPLETRLKLDDVKAFGSVQMPFQCQEESFLDRNPSTDSTVSNPEPPIELQQAPQLRPLKTNRLSLSDVGIKIAEDGIYEAASLTIEDHLSLAKHHRAGIGHWSPFDLEARAMRHEETARRIIAEQMSKSEKQQHEKNVDTESHPSQTQSSILNASKIETASAKQGGPVERVRLDILPISPSADESWLRMTKRSALFKTENNKKPANGLSSHPTVYSEEPFGDAVGFLWDLRHTILLILFVLSSQNDFLYHLGSAIHSFCSSFFSACGYLDSASQVFGIPYFSACDSFAWVHEAFSLVWEMLLVMVLCFGGLLTFVTCCDHTVRFEDREVVSH